MTAVGTLRGVGVAELRSWAYAPVAEAARTYAAQHDEIARQLGVAAQHKHWHATRLYRRMVQHKNLAAWHRSEARGFEALAAGQ